MGYSQRLAAVAAVSHANLQHYNHTHTDVTRTDATSYSVNIFFVSATLCGVLVAVCAACWRRLPSSDKPEETDCHGVYTVSGDARLAQIQVELPGPPPAYETVVEGAGTPPHKDCISLQEVVTEPCARCHTRRDSGLPTYEAAVKLKDTKL